MSGMIKISGNGNSVIKAIIKNLRVDGKITSSGFTIKYNVENFKSLNLKHFININGERKEITKDVIYDKENNEFSYTLKSLTSGTVYNIQIEINDSDIISKSEILQVKTEKSVIYGIKVDNTNSNVSTSITYIEDSIDFTPATNDSFNIWQNRFPFNKIKLVGFKEGKETKYINVTNRTQYIDGSFAPTDVDIMVKIPKVYWNFKNTSNGYELRISDSKIDDNWDCYAHKVNGIEKDFIYVGAYLGSVINDKLRSYNSSMPTTSKTLTQFRNYARANGEGYQLWNWNTLILIQILYLMAYKNLDSQIALGQGYTGVGGKTTTGGTNRRNLCYGSIDNSIQMCFLGIEDLWGNCRQWVDGIVYNKNGEILVTPDNKTFNDDGSNYKNLGKFSTPKNGYISDISHTNESGFFPTAFNGSSNTYYSDMARISINCIPVSGGYYRDMNNAGIFNLSVEFTASGSGSGVGTRLCYLG
ncbi:hypothetical protein [Peptacetobacter sp. AB800]|uniref:hypothetical protein n=1 Tax=Peptacetobacter sp. AB800 TaxID=3388428 RepID=UPI0039FD4E63